MAMAGESDDPGDTATGALAAHAIHPQEGEAACLNGGTALAGAYCHRCG
jgi:hypothetical protein